MCVYNFLPCYAEYVKVLFCDSIGKIQMILRKLIIRCDIDHSSSFYKYWNKRGVLFLCIRNTAEIKMNFKMFIKY
jgi:hypothetical protein